MRRIALLATFGAVALLFVPQVAEAQSTQVFNAHFTSVQQRKAAPCPGGILDFCGTGSISGFGPASYELHGTGVTRLNSQCSLVTSVATVTLAYQRGTFTAETTATFCFTSKTQSSAALAKSFGNPFKASGSFVITGGTGVLAGASGGGTATLRGAGARSVLDATGTIAP